MGKPCNNDVVISDIHAGCRMALCPPDGVPLDDGGRYMPSPFQLKIHSWWTELWEDWLPRTIHKEPFDLIINGDSLDGVHHDSVTQISHNLADQQNIAEMLLKPIANKARKVYVIRGTEAHTGKSGQFEEMLAKSLGAEPNSEGQYARHDLWKYFGEGQWLAHYNHHIGTTGTQAYESTAVLKELIEAYTEAGRWGGRCPDVCVRSHRHRAISVEVPTHNIRGISLVTPGWQGKTPFSYAIAGGRQAQPQFGAVLIRDVPRDGVWYTYSKTWSLDRPEPEGGSDYAS